MTEPRINFESVEAQKKKINDLSKSNKTKSPEEKKNSQYRFEYRFAD